MSDHFSAAQDCSIADSSEPGLSTPGSARSTLPPEGSSLFAGPAYPSTRMLEQSGQSSLMSTYSQQGFPAPTSLSLDSVPALAGQTADYGLKSPESFASYDPVSCSWRTCQASLFGGWTEFSGTWPQAGMTRNGTAYRLRPSAPRTYERASGLLPTPLASETGYRKGAYTQGGKALSTVLGGRPNPEYVEWMMGVPQRWTDCDCSETASSLQSLNGSGE